MNHHPLLSADVPIGPLTTYKLGGAARWFAEVGDIAELAELAALASSGGTALFILGRGSNVVVADGGFDGIVVRLVGDLALAASDDGVVTAGAGMPLPRLARFASSQGLGGLEFYIGIPGSVGGAVRMNAGGHGSDTASVLIDATVMDASDGSVRTVAVADLVLGYRTSNLGDGDIVVAARFATVPRPHREIEAELRDITRWRKEHQPGGTLNAGSVFKNPPGDAAGRIIDDLGLKGYRRGAVSVSTLHANFVVAEAGATAQDVWDLVWDVRRRVGEATGTWLEPEVRFIGAFAETEQSREGSAS
jgi:UDP-N-acetylmuramate dehydrogenase